MNIIKIFKFEFLKRFWILCCIFKISILISLQSLYLIEVSLLISQYCGKIVLKKTKNGKINDNFEFSTEN
jgi:hypothetical protein